MFNVYHHVTTWLFFKYELVKSSKLILACSCHHTCSSCCSDLQPATKPFYIFRYITLHLLFFITTIIILWSSCLSLPSTLLPAGFLAHDFLMILSTNWILVNLKRIAFFHDVPKNGFDLLPIKCLWTWIKSWTPEKNNSIFCSQTGLLSVLLITIA